MVEVYEDADNGEKEYFFNLLLATSDNCEIKVECTSRIGNGIGHGNNVRLTFIQAVHQEKQRLGMSLLFVEIYIRTCKLTWKLTIKVYLKRRIGIESVKFLKNAVLKDIPIICCLKRRTTELPWKNSDILDPASVVK